MVSKIVTNLGTTHTVGRYVWILVLLYIGFRLLDEITWRLGELLLRSFKPQMIEGVRWRLFAAILRRPYAFFVNASSGRVGHWINQVT
jgi:ABC-type multidrug transport system fused ATPase/permease subunit